MIPTRTASVAVAVALAAAAATAATPAAPGLAAQDASADYTEPYQRQAFEIYRTAIGFRTAAGHGQVPALARYLADEFRAGGFPAEDVHVLPQTVPGGEETASLVVNERVPVRAFFGALEHWYTILNELAGR
ncbi:hypothetical protein [Candidatus Palauibacter sp.]|uniref:hypothetical protein n=1 Tax=Candidatus Palauibacter sp. TaxID=3101350 RepID=UPI003B010DFD